VPCGYDQRVHKLAHIALHGRAAGSDAVRRFGLSCFSLYFFVHFCVFLISYFISLFSQIANVSVRTTAWYQQKQNTGTSAHPVPNIFVGQRLETGPMPPGGLGPRAKGLRLQPSLAKELGHSEPSRMESAVSVFKQFQINTAILLNPLTGVSAARPCRLFLATAQVARDIEP
jgi:hypothetical protein